MSELTSFLSDDEIRGLEEHCNANSRYGVITIPRVALICLLQEVRALRTEKAHWGSGVLIKRRLINAVQAALESRPKGGMHVGTPHISIRLDVSTAMGLMNLLDPPVPSLTPSDDSP